MSEITTTKPDTKAMLEAYMKKKGVSDRHGRLIFSLDATLSREATWTHAAKLQTEMLGAVADGSLDLKIVFFRGDECQQSPWLSNPYTLAHLLSKVKCKGGLTQIEKVFDQIALAETRKEQVNALIFIGDSMEEDLERLSRLASELGTAKVPCFMFQEGEDEDVERAYKLIAQRSGGTFFKFGLNSPQAVAQFTDQLVAVARLAVGDASAIAAITHKKNGE